MTNQEFFIHRWKQELPLTVNCLRYVPEDKWSWQPHPKTRTAKQLVDHLVSHAEDLVEGVETGVVNHRVMANYPSIENAIDEFQKQSEKLMQLVASTSEEDWNDKTVPFLVFGNKLMEHPMRDICWLFLFDIVHHRGQLSVYFRPMGVANPAIYGPTAEMTEAMMSQMTSNN